MASAELAHGRGIALREWVAQSSQTASPAFSNAAASNPDLTSAKQPLLTTLRPISSSPRAGYCLCATAATMASARGKFVERRHFLECRGHIAPRSPSAHRSYRATRTRDRVLGAGYLLMPIIVARDSLKSRATAETVTHFSRDRILRRCSSVDLHQD